MQAAQKISKARRAKFDELRRTLQYVEASRASATTPMSLFNSLLIHELLLKVIHPIIAFLELSFRGDVERFVETAATRL
jgi:hypothetical protein